MDLPDLLLASLSPATRSQAESTLANLANTQPNFLISLLQLVLVPTQALQARQAAAVYFKNVIKRRWDAEANEEQPIDPAEKTALRSQLIPAMVALASQSNLLRSQIAESVGIVAGVDFPVHWPNLLGELARHLSPTDYGTNMCILETAHSIFHPWRSATRSDSLYTSINEALSQFQDPFFQTFSATAPLLLSGQAVPKLELVAQSQTYLVAIYLDLTFQDMPPKFEDTMSSFFGGDGNEGVFVSFLKWDPPQLKGDADEPQPTEPMKLKTTILEICELFLLKYNEEFGSRVPAFVQAVWELIGTSTLAVREDALVSQAIKFLSVTAKSGLHRSLFSQPGTLEALTERIIVPSMPLREHEVEQFEDDPLEYIRRDMSLGSEGSETRRHAAQELIRALMSIGLEAEITKLIEHYISMDLQNYVQNPKENWQSKDTAIYLLTAVAAQASTSLHGVTSTNALVDVVKFFTDNIASDLSGDMAAVHPILQVDAIRFVYTFRYQLTKDQLLVVLPLLVRHIASSNYVCYTYAAIAIERILFMKSGAAPIFNQVDIQQYSTSIITALFALIQSGGTPAKVAENEYLMKCVMRVIIVAKQTLAENYSQLLGRLVEILGVICQNPSNPLFNQYTFESVSALLRFVSAADPSSVTQFEAVLFGPFTIILQNDIEQFIPYVFQILAQMLETHTTTIPDAYRGLLPLLLTPPVWQQRGNVPALVRLVSAFLEKDVNRMESDGQLRTVIAIVQQRLLPSKLNDQYGFELIHTIVRTVPPELLIGLYFGAILNSLFTRLQTSKTDKFTYSLARLVFTIAALQEPGLGPNFVVSEVEKVQSGIWGQLSIGILLPEIPKTRARDTRATAAGIVRLLTGSQLMLSPQGVDIWQKMFTSLEQWLSKGEHISKETADDDPDAALTAIDYEEQTAGYQAAFSKLAASQPKRVDPVAHVVDPIAFVKQTLSAATQDPNVRQRLESLPQSPWARGLLSGQLF